MAFFLTFLKRIFRAKIVAFVDVRLLHHIFSVNVIYQTSLSISKAYFGVFICFQCLKFLMLYICMQKLLPELLMFMALHVSAFSLSSCKLAFCVLMLCVAAAVLNRS